MLAHYTIGVAAQAWDEQRCPGGPPGGDPLAALGHPHLALAVQGEGPPMQARSCGRPEWEALLGRGAKALGRPQGSESAYPEGRNFWIHTRIPSLWALRYKANSPAS